MNSNALETPFLTLLLSVKEVLVKRQDCLAVGVRLNAYMAGNTSAFIYFASVQEGCLSGSWLWQ